MKIQDQVITLAQAKKLKELGVVQDSFMYFVGAYENTEDQDLELVPAYGYNWNDYPEQSGFPIKYAAFTVAELGVMLPALCYTEHFTWMEWQWSNIDNAPVISKGNFNTEAEARADLLIYLLEHDIITASEVNQRLQQ